MEDFSIALQRLKAGQRVRRASWAPNSFVEMRGVSSLFSVDSSTGVEWAYFASEDDIMADDWQLIA